MNFDQWWSDAYAGKIAPQSLERAFREVAEAAWKDACSELHGLAERLAGRNAELLGELDAAHKLNGKLVEQMMALRVQAAQQGVRIDG